MTCELPLYGGERDPVVFFNQQHISDTIGSRCADDATAAAAATAARCCCCCWLLLLLLLQRPGSQQGVRLYGMGVSDS